MGEKKHINKITPKIPGESREYFVFMCFVLLYVFLFAPTVLGVSHWSYFVRLIRVCLAVAVASAGNH